MLHLERTGVDPNTFDVYKRYVQRETEADTVLAFGPFEVKLSDYTKKPGNQVVVEMFLKNIYHGQKVKVYLESVERGQKVKYLLTRIRSDSVVEGEDFVAKHLPGFLNMHGKNSSSRPMDPFDVIALRYPAPAKAEPMIGNMTLRQYIVNELRGEKTCPKERTQKKAAIPAKSSGRNDRSLGSASAAG